MVTIPAFSTWPTGLSGAVVVEGGVGVGVASPIVYVAVPATSTGDTDGLLGSGGTLTSTTPTVKESPGGPRGPWLGVGAGALPTPPVG
jgi:hypothetical protein